MGAVMEVVVVEDVVVVMLKGCAVDVVVDNFKAMAVDMMLVTGHSGIHMLRLRVVVTVVMAVDMMVVSEVMEQVDTVNMVLLQLQPVAEVDGVEVGEPPGFNLIEELNLINF